MFEASIENVHVRSINRQRGKSGMLRRTLFYKLISDDY